jgi:hypothetical protein
VHGDGIVGITLAGGFQELGRRVVDAVVMFREL